jgi:phage protein D
MGLEIAIAVGGKADSELAEATTVEVYERMGAATTYSLRYEVDISEGDLPMLVDERLDAGSELSILVPIEDTTHCLVKGPLHGQQIHIEHGGADSWVEVQGSDSLIVMDRKTQSVVWADVTDSDAVTSILCNYGYTPDVQSTSAGHFEKKHTLVQRESDLGFVRRLARRNGFLFWVTCDAQGNETAHFKRPPLEGGADVKLVIHLASPSLQTLDISWDVERPTSIEGTQLDLNTKKNLEIAVNQTPQTILGDHSLSKITGDTRSVHLSAPADDAGDMRARGEGALIEADWFIHATCQTSLEFSGIPVRAHTIVELRGAGSRHSGKYFVAGVRHTIDATAHRMDLELIRNGWSG